MLVEKVDSSQRDYELGNIMYESIDVGRRPEASNRKIALTLAGISVAALGAVLTVFLT